MSRYRDQLPQLQKQPFLTDGGLETTLVFHERIDLPDFAAFPLLADEAGSATLRRYFEAYADIAMRHDSGLILESATWRASSDWGARLGYSPATLTDANRASIAMLSDIRDRMEHARPVVLSGCLGPRGDGYIPAAAMTARQAEEYHRAQVETFAETNADMVSAITMNDSAEAIGIARAARSVGMPVAIAFTVETNGRLPTGQPLGEAIEEVDASTDDYPAYYMINCAHPDHMAPALEGAWTTRIGGLRANASRKSHAELNESTELDAGDPVELAALYTRLLGGPLARANVLGGCCGTDHRHVERIAEACVPLLR